MMNSTKTNDVLDLIKQGLSTAYNIAQMTHYRVRYLTEKDSSKNRAKMIKFTCLVGLGILGLLAIGISDLSKRK